MEGAQRCCCLVVWSCLILCELWTEAHEAPLSMGFSRQEYWSGWPFPSPRDLPNPRIKPGSSALRADSLPSEPSAVPYAEGAAHRWYCGGPHLPFSSITLPFICLSLLFTYSSIYLFITSTEVSHNFQDPPWDLLEASSPLLGNSVIGLGKIIGQ